MPPDEGQEEFEEVQREFVSLCRHPPHHMLYPDCGGQPSDSTCGRAVNFCAVMRPPSCPDRALSCFVHRLPLVSSRSALALMWYRCKQSSRRRRRSGTLVYIRPPLPRYIQILCSTPVVPSPAASISNRHPFLYLLDAFPPV